MDHARSCAGAPNPEGLWDQQDSDQEPVVDKKASKVGSMAHGGVGTIENFEAGPARGGIADGRSVDAAEIAGIDILAALPEQCSGRGWADMDKFIGLETDDGLAMLDETGLAVPKIEAKATRAGGVGGADIQAKADVVWAGRGEDPRDHDDGKRECQQEPGGYPQGAGEARLGVAGCGQRFTAI